MLSALELNGFKSFADRTRLDFPGGITMVVGPNGSGKSNVVDAIRWVLGAQSIKSLRGKEMTDVIFSGSRTRRAANAAEASIILDNSAGLLDHDAQEIQITRRAYRSGESEYLINRQPCRLRDIRDLLASAGVSTTGYGIIEQGRVDAVLQASPKERRAIFEEAAGISRFRLKREEAARRLERIEQNLLRLGDIVEELRSRLNTVRAQASRAQRYSELSRRVQELRTQLGLDEWRELTRHIDQQGAAVTRQETTLHELESLQAERDARVTELEARLEQLGNGQRDALTEDAALRERLAQCESTRSSELARIEELEQEVVRLSHQLLMLTSRAGDSHQLVAETSVELQRAEQELAELQFQVARDRDEVAAVATEMDAERSRHAEATRSLNAIQGEGVQLQAARQLLHGKRQAAESTLSARDAEAAPLAESRERFAADAAHAKSELGRATQQMEHAAVELAAAQRRLTDDRAQFAAVQKRIAELNGRLAGARERTAVLEELEVQLDGLTSGAKLVLRRAREEPEGPFRGVHGVVADLLHVDADMASLVEIALGERANHLVVGEAHSLAATLAEQSSQWPSRTTFLRLDVPAPASAVDRIDLAGEPGVVGRADEFVESAASVAPLARRLLGRFWFVDSLPTALALASGVGRGLNFVTVGGESLLADGTLAVGPRQYAAGMLTRRSELRALRDEMERLRTSAADAEQEGDVLERKIAEQDAAQRQLATVHAELARAHGEVRLRAASRAERLGQIDDRLAALADERAKLAQQIELHDRELADSHDRLQSIELDQVNWRETIGASTQRQRELEERAAKLQSQLTDESIALARSEQRVEGLRRQTEQLAHDHAERDRALEEMRARAVQCQGQRTNLQASVAHLAEEIVGLNERRQAMAASLIDMERQRQACQADRVGAVADADGTRNQTAAVRGRVHALRLQLQQVEQQRQSLADRMLEDYKLDLHELANGGGGATEHDGSPASPLDRAAVEAEMRDLREQMQAGGPVNLDAVVELEQLENRSGGLVAQYEDLQQARERLSKVIEQINGESRQLFVDAVAEVRGHFQEIFKKLFAGGEADVVIEDDPSGDVLECGVSIVAQPPGKQPRNISLLSGGERTLTCVALLLAVFRSRPSPFCVLDEVDAALDEANIDRFVALVQEFMTSTQFIVITHSKRTMTCADALHGITMQESGVSKRVSVRFEDVGEDGRIRATALRAADLDEQPRSRAA
jgi:chromosome segregation protein